MTAPGGAVTWGCPEYQRNTSCKKPCDYTRLLAIMEQAAEPPELRLNWVTDVKGLEYLEAVRLCDR